MGNNVSKPDWRNLGNFITILRCFKVVLNKVLFKILHETHESKGKVSTLSTTNSQQKMKSTILPTTEAEILLKEILSLSDLIERYLQCSSEETASPLRSLFDHGKSEYIEYFTPEKIEEFLEILRTMESARVKNLEDENKSLRIEKQEILEIFGEIMVEKMAKDNEERRSERFRRILRSSLPKDETTGESAACPPMNTSADLGRQSIQRIDVLAQQSNHDPGKEDMVRKDELKKEEQSNDQSLAQQSYDHEDLPFPIQQEDEGGREHISLGHIPPTSVATAVYNNYKLLLLSLAKKLTPVDVMILKAWASENFLIESGQNATHLLLELDEKEVINASDLSQLSSFFKLISRTDLVNTIEVFLLGDYNSFQQILNGRRTTESNPGPRTSSSAMSTVGSNGLKHSTLRRSVTERNKPPKARDTKMVKCVYCDNVQQFGQFCCDCGAQFAEYYCGMCKHLTSTDNQPHHCEKYGICRVHDDRSFHCDTCGVCLDISLRGNHKCRENTIHDECCICSEVAFTGCQLLPCSHKVHKECITQMIRSGITRCPICRERFARSG